MCTGSTLSDVDVNIEVQQAAPGQPPVVVVTPSSGGANRVLASLLAAGLLVVISAGIGLALRQRRERPGTSP